jgi:predicted alpha-1,2-mannosidase
MKSIVLIAFLLTILQKDFVFSQALLPYVQPFSGTAPATTVQALKHGEGTEKNANTIPSVGLPFGMTQFTPQTRLTENKCVPPFFYKDSLFSGFRATHWISGSCTQDYGSFTVMPITGKLRTIAKDYAVPFSRLNETSTPAYYKIDLSAYHLSAEISSSLRCGIMQFTMQQSDSLYILVTPNSDKEKGFVNVDAEKGEIWAYNPVHRIYQGWGNPAGFNGWIFIKIDKVIDQSGTFRGASLFKKDSICNGKDIGAYIGFSMKKGEKLCIRVGTSFSSLEGARKNLEQEIPSWDFEEIHKKAVRVWEETLSRIRVESENEKEKRIFYTAMYHAMQHPRLFSDVDGTYPKFAGNYELMKMDDGDYYDDFSMWDIYRAQLPLLEILQPSLIDQFVQSMILKAQQGGWLPIFPCWNSFTSAMIGDHVTAFIASAWAKGIRNYDGQEAYRVARKNAFEMANDKDYINGMGRRGLSSYLKYGFIPMEDSVPIAFHKKEQVSRTLEYAYDDYALSGMAKDLGKMEDYVKLHERAFNYKNVFDKSEGMMRGRYSTGKWFESFHPDLRESYITEGTPRQYTFYVPQDVPGLAKLMGGDIKLETALDSLFAKNEYWHGNEPGHQIPFMYNFTASPWKTQKQVLRILQEEYSDGPGGLGGNDDAGQMSAWYIFASMGFYPLNPVSGEYLCCTPLFEKVCIQLAGNKKFEIVCHKSSDRSIYIRRMDLNGKPYHKNFIDFSILATGGKLELWLQDDPSSWGSKKECRPLGLTAN